MSDIQFKGDVRIPAESFLRSEVMRIIWAVGVTAPSGYTATMTCGKEDHAPETHHGKGEAFDIRTKDFPHDVHVWARRIQALLGSAYFVQVEPNESCPNAQPHIHIQYNGG